jgi:hypothetical protein
MVNPYSVTYPGALVNRGLAIGGISQAVHGERSSAYPVWTRLSTVDRGESGQAKADPTPLQ